MADLDVLLVAPGTELASRGSWNREPPLGLQYLAAVLERDGFSCQLLELDATCTIEDSLSAIPVPALVGFTSLTNTCRGVLQACRATKNFYHRERHADPIVVMGGPHATFAYREVLAAGAVDACVLGEAEGTIGTIAGAAIAAGTVPSFTRYLAGMASSLNVALTGGAGTVVTGNIVAGRPSNLDALPFPARHLSPINKPGHVYDVATVLVNRGCPNQCIFCSRQALFKRPRSRSPGHIIEELASIHAAGTYEHYNLYDNLTVSPRFARQVLDAMIADRRLGLPWGAELRADMVDERLARLLGQAGCKLAAVGVESADENILRVAGKTQSIARVDAGLARLKREGIRVQAYFVVGLPGETRDTFQRTIAFIEDSALVAGEDTIDFFAATPYPGSALLERHVELGIELVDHDFDHYDCQHVTCRPSSVSLAGLLDIFTEAKAFERRFNARSR